MFKICFKRLFITKCFKCNNIAVKAINHSKNNNFVDFIKLVIPNRLDSILKSNDLLPDI